MSAVADEEQPPPGDGSSSAHTRRDRFTVVYRDNAARVLGYLRARGADDPEAMTQEVFLAYYDRSERVTGGPAGERALLFSIAHARLVDDYRDRARRPAIRPYDVATDTRTTASAEEGAVAITGERGALDLLRALPEEYREVIALRVIAGLPIATTAEIMARSEGAIKQLQRRALEKLRTALQEKENDDAPA